MFTNKALQKIFKAYIYNFLLTIYFRMTCWTKLKSSSQIR